MGSIGPIPYCPSCACLRTSSGLIISSSCNAYWSCCSWIIIFKHSYNKNETVTAHNHLYKWILLDWLGLQVPAIFIKQGAEKTLCVIFCMSLGADNIRVLFTDLPLWDRWCLVHYWLKSFYLLISHFAISLCSFTSVETWMRQISSCVVSRAILRLH